MHEMTLPEKDAQRSVAMREGSQGHQLWAELDVQPEDERVLKTRYSAFIQGSSDLPELVYSYFCPGGRRSSVVANHSACVLLVR